MSPHRANVTRPATARPPDRAATEAALQSAARARAGAHGGVAAEAAVNRGLVSHYFGSRRALLRAALRSDLRQRIGDFEPAFGLPAPTRLATTFRTFLRHRRGGGLAARLA